MNYTVSSRQRMLAALSCQPVDHTPCSFMIYGGLKSRSRDYKDFLERQLALGLDTVVELPPRPPVVVNDSYNLHGLPVSYHPAVTIEETTVERPGERFPVMVKQYHTPEGSLQVEVLQTEDWRWGNHIPFLDDYIVPRARKFPVSQPADLKALRYLLVPPTAAEVEVFRQESLPYQEFARTHDLLVSGGWGVGADMVGWIYGLEPMIYASYNEPDFVHEMLAIIAAWNRRRMQVVLDAGVDLYVKRAWYENCDFFSPKSWRKFIRPILQEDVALAHQAGARFGYIITSNCMALLDLIAETGVDVIIGVDPHMWELKAAKEKLGQRLCLWGGVNGHLTVEQGSAASVRQETAAALEILAPGGGFILSPVDNVREDTPRARENAAALIDEWQSRTGQK